MSHDLRIWERPVGQPEPTTFDEACRTLLALEGLEPGTSPKFMALAAQMAARYPVLGRESAFDGDEDDNDSGVAWVGDPVASASRCTSAVWAFELPTDDLARALHFVVLRANALGLTVFDDQLGMAFIPPDRVLPPEMAMVWEGAKREMNAAPLRWTLATARKAIKQHLRVLVESHGFDVVKLPPKSMLDAEYMRKTEAGIQRITVHGRSFYSQPQFSFGVEISSEVIAEILREVFPEKGAMYGGGQYADYQFVFEISQFGGFPAAEIPVESDADVHRVLRVVEEPTLRILDMTRTLSGMERVMNDATSFPLSMKSSLDPKSLAEQCRRLGYASLISAWLHGNEQFEEIAAYIGRLSDDSDVTTQQAEHGKLDRVLTYLRAHVARQA